MGKSSLINAITRKKQLAMTSQMPGKTLLINHFLINNEWHLVDLPGYGYARRSKDQRQELAKIIDSYIMMRKQLVNLFILVDIRHEPQAIDLEFINRMGEWGVPFSIVFTKHDKLSKSRADLNVEAYKKKLLEDWEELPPIFVTSSETKYGCSELLDYIEQLNKSISEDTI